MVTTHAQCASQISYKISKQFHSAPSRQQHKNMQKVIELSTTRAIIVSFKNHGPSNGDYLSEIGCKTEFRYKLCISLRKEKIFFCALWEKYLNHCIVPLIPPHLSKIVCNLHALAS